MKTNTEIQLYPFLRIAGILVIGILAGKFSDGKMSADFWLSVTLTFLLLSMGLSYLPFHVRRQSHSSPVYPAVFQTCCIFATVFALGAWNCVMTLQTHQLARVGERVHCHAVLLTPPKQHGKVVRGDLILTDGPFKGKKVRASFLNTPSTLKEGADASLLQVGEGLETVLYMDYTTQGRQKGNFDYQLWLKIHGFIGTVFLMPSDWKSMTVSLSGLSVYQRTVLAALQLRQKLIKKGIRLEQDGQDEAVIEAMALGEESGISKSTTEAYSISGASHILSLSGLHLGIIYGILAFFLGGRNRWWNQVLILLAIWSFVVLVGSGPSVVRSAMMISIYALVSLLNRDKFSLNSWALALFVMLMTNPLFLFDIGFEMSFLAVWGILLGIRLFPLPPETRTKRALVRKVTVWGWGFLITSLSAQFWTFPLVIYYFGRFSCYFLLTNLVVIPVSTALLYLVAGGFALSLWDWAADSLFRIADMMAGLLNRTVAWVASLPGSSIEGLSIDNAQLVLIYIVIMGLFTLFFVTLRPQ